MKLTAESLAAAPPAKLAGAVRAACKEVITDDLGKLATCGFEYRCEAPNLADTYARALLMVVEFAELLPVYASPLTECERGQTMADSDIKARLLRFIANSLLDSGVALAVPGDKP